MSSLLVVLFVVLVISFCSLLLTRHRNRGTIALHRHPDNLRRRTHEPVELSTTADIISIMKSDQTGHFKSEDKILSPTQE